MTAIRVDPEPIIVSILDPKMKECPFLYTIETGSLESDGRGGANSSANIS